MPAGRRPQLQHTRVFAQKCPTARHSSRQAKRIFGRVHAAGNIINHRTVKSCAANLGCQFRRREQAPVPVAKVTVQHCKIGTVALKVRRLGGQRQMSAAPPVARNIIFSHHALHIVDRLKRPTPKMTRKLEPVRFTDPTQRCLEAGRQHAAIARTCPPPECVLLQHRHARTGLRQHQRRIQSGEAAAHNRHIHLLGHFGTDRNILRVRKLFSPKVFSFQKSTSIKH